MVSFNVSVLGGLIGVLALVLADWLLGIIAAFRLNTFQLTYLFHQLAAQFAPLGGLAIIGVIQALSINGAPVVSGALVGVFFAGSATYVVNLGADILAKLGVVMSGQVPAVTAAKVIPINAGPLVVRHTAPPPVP